TLDTPNLQANPTLPVPTTANSFVKPAALHFQANFFQASGLNPLKKPALGAVKFGQGPTQPELNAIQGMLKGGNASDVLAPNYLPSPEVVRSLYQLITDNTPVPESLQKVLTQQKTEAMNLHHFLLGKPLLNEGAVAKDAQQFVADFGRKMKELDGTLLTPANGFGVAEKEIFHLFAANTAPILFTMGFADAIDHSGDVARLAVKQALKYGGNKQEVLQAALVGWLHDPKLRGDLSWSNLATHPVVGSAIAQELLNQPALSNKIQQYLDFVPESSTQSHMGLAEFKKGIVEALSVNNDSEFVLRMVILNKMPKHPLAEPGIADVVPEAKEEFLKRFKAPSLGETPVPVSDDLKAKIDTVNLSTDLKGISLLALKTALGVETEAEAKKAFKAIVSGETPLNAGELQALKGKLLEIPGALVNPQVKGTTLLSHHGDLIEGAKAGLALAISDPLLLSPHKIVAASFEPFILGRITSFAKSIEDNIKALPLAAQPEGQIWLKDLYRSILEASSELTGKNPSELLTQAREASTALQSDVSLLAEVQLFKSLVTAPSTWVSKEANGVDFGSIQATAPENKATVDKIVSVLKKHYEAAAQQSEGLFATVTAKDSATAIFS
ncbi:MAG: hypothetical protein K2X66_02140, partial [Cyanobacteria bacterium]|nr:hypothetical protein [Cyanobacteriota bacterium]